MDHITAYDETKNTTKLTYDEIYNILVFSITLTYVQIKKDRQLISNV